MKNILKKIPVLLLCFFVIIPINAEKSEREKRLEILDYGLDTEIISLLDTLEEEKNTEYNDEIKQVFDSSRNIEIKNRILDFFGSVSSDLVKDFAISVIDDPYDYRQSTIDAAYSYVKSLKIQEAAPLLRKLLDTENQEYQKKSISLLGEIGGPDDAAYLADYLSRPIDEGTRQEIVIALGKLQAVDTWQTLSDIVADEDENTFTRMYAAEAIGKMNKSESVPVLAEAFLSENPNLRQYAVKGLSYYNTPEAVNVILQGFRDSYYKVRIESAEAVKKQKIEEGIPFLIYRASNDPETVVKTSAFRCLTVFSGNTEVSDFFKESFLNEKNSDTIRIEAARGIIESDFSGSFSVVETWILENLGNSRFIKLIYEFTKLFSKKESTALEPLCKAYAGSKDVILQNFAMEMYTVNKFASVQPQIEVFAKNDQNPSLQKKAKKALGIED